MPLISSPIDGSPMRQINRYGVEIDVCQTSGGIWLDKGELEKIMAILREDSSAAHSLPKRAGHHGEIPRGKYREDDDDDYDDDDFKRGYKKKSKISRVMDIFDF